MSITVKISKKERIDKIFLKSELSLKARGLYGFLISYGEAEITINEIDMFQLFEKDKPERVFETFQELEKSGAIILKKKFKINDVLNKTSYHYELQGVN